MAAAEPDRHHAPALGPLAGAGEVQAATAAAVIAHPDDARELPVPLPAGEPGDTVPVGAREIR